MKQVGAVTSADRLSGHHHGCGCGYKPEWEFIPPFLVFRPNNYRNYLIAMGKDDSAVFANESGWVTGVNFVLSMEHFIKRTSVTKDKPLLILLDSDKSHLDIKVLDLAKENGVVMSFPPHTSLKCNP